MALRIEVDVTQLGFHVLDQMLDLGYDLYREIAERLTVSIRTVEGHIYRACIKLDVADRDALARIVWN